MSYEFALPPLAADANKYTRGKLLVIAGSKRYPGSAVLAACASERMGSGYTEVVTAPAAMPLVLAASPSVVVRDRERWDASSLAAEERHPVAAALGSGFKGSTKERALTLEVLRKAHCPLLIDGTALGFLSGKKELRALMRRAERGWPTVFTPHGGEAARLARGLGLALTEPAALSAALAQACRCTVALKGPVTYISQGSTTVAMEAGTAALAKAGSGDVLAGMVGSLLAQGMGPMDAAYAGAWIHGRAGALAAQQTAERSVVAMDIIQRIPAIIKGM